MLYSLQFLYCQWKFKNKKKGEPINFNQFSDRVTPEGFEPSTVRAEI